VQSALSPDGQRIVTAGGDGTAMVYGVVALSIVAELLGECRGSDRSWLRRILAERRTESLIFGTRGQPRTRALDAGQFLWKALWFSGRAPSFSKAAPSASANRR
jgi:hypothetical protein